MSACIPFVVANAMKGALLASYNKRCVFLGGDFTDIDELLNSDRGNSNPPVCIVCEEVVPVNRTSCRAWEGNIAVEVISSRDQSYELAANEAAMTFYAVENGEAAFRQRIEGGGKFLLGKFEPGPQSVRIEESIRVISATYRVQLGPNPTV